MATFRLRRFSRPNILKAIAPVPLIEFLTPYLPFLAKQGFRLDPGRPCEAGDYHALARIFLAADPAMPTGLINALYYVDEMAVPEGTDALLAEAALRGIPLDPNPRRSPADVAVQVWVRDQSAVERRHAMLHAQNLLGRKRSYLSYQAARSPLPAFATPTEPLLQGLAAALDVGFEAKDRGRGTRIFLSEREHEAWFLVRHGDLFQREENVQEGESGTVHFRPPKYDIVVYLPGTGELRVNAGSPWERELHRVEFGRVLFRDRDLFQRVPRFTLEPLRGADSLALACKDVEGVEAVTLKEVQWFWGGEQNTSESVKADDVFAALKALGRSLPDSAPLTRAAFLVKFADSPTPRSVVIKPPCNAVYTRDDDARWVEEWLILRGFILDHDSRRAAGDHTPLARP